MSIRQHVGEDLLLAYASGELDEASSLLVATHVALCPQCRDELDIAETLGGAFLEQVPVKATDDSTLDAIFQRLDGAGAASETPHETGEKCVLPQPLRDYAGGDIDSIEWRSLGGGVKHCLIETASERAKARLLKIPAGMKVPDHGHRGRELTLVLTGSFYDQGIWFRRGDVEEADATLEHEPVAGPEEPCICLAVTDAPLRFRSLLPRLAQPFFRL